MGELVKEQTKVLRLSGTPFNLLDDFKEDEIYTWDYVMEQRAKRSWDELHFGDPNPYASLPTLNIYTYDLGRLLHEFVDEDVAFNFREFFRVNEKRCAGFSESSYQGGQGQPLSICQRGISEYFPPYPLDGAWREGSTGTECHAPDTSGVPAFQGGQCSR